MLSLFRLFILLVLMLISLSCSDSKPDKLLLSLSDDFNTSYVDTNRDIQIRVYANFDDGSQEEVSDVLEWSSSNASLATVSKGLVHTSSQEGDVVISYKTAESKEDTTPVFEKSYPLSIKNLTLESIKLSKTSLSLYEKESEHLYAMGLFEGNVSLDITQDCEWSSSDTTVSSVDNAGESKGVVHAVAEGSATITAASGGVSASADVVVKKLEYKGLEVDNNDTSFNVEQSIELQVSAVGSDGSRVILSSDALEFTSSDSEIVSLNENNATAVAKGEATITITLKSNTELTTTVLLRVEQDQYVRLFKNGKEVTLPFIDAQEYDALPKEDDTFILKAVGLEYSVSNLSVTDFAGNALSIYEGYFDGLREGDTLPVGVEVPFTLVKKGTSKEFHFSFTVNDAFHNLFSQKYKERD